MFVTVEIVTLFSNNRFRNALELHNNIPTSRIISGIQPQHSAHIYKRYGARFNETNYWEPGTKHIHWGKIGRWALFLSTLLNMKKDQVHVQFEDDVTFDKSKWMKTIDFIYSKRAWEVEYPIFRLSKYNQCLIYNGATIQKIKDKIQKTLIDNPNDMYLMRYNLSKTIDIRFETKQFDSELLNYKVNNEHLVTIKKFNSMIDEQN